jgi:hypothetical protein
MGLRVSLRGSNPEPLMSALGQKQTERLITAWNERQALHAPLIFSVGQAVLCGVNYL